MVFQGMSYLIDDNAAWSDIILHGRRSLRMVGTPKNVLHDILAILGLMAMDDVLARDLLAKIIFLHGSQSVFMIVDLFASCKTLIIVDILIRTSLIPTHPN